MQEERDGAQTVSNSRQYARGLDFPNEGFVQQAVEKHFHRLGFAEVPEGDADLACRHPETGERWVIEAKGETTAVGLDFRTGLGQLLQHMEDRCAKHALAVPDTPKFRRQIDKVPGWARKALGIHWLVVGERGNVTVVPPTDG